MRKIYVVAALHGEEMFGLKIIAHLQSLEDARIITCIAHPEAVAKKRRFLDTDLNRSFGSNTSLGRESIIASRLLQDIRAQQPDVVIDLHTSHGTVGKVAILASHSSRLQAIAKHLNMERAVIMPEVIAHAALIGQLPECSLSLEFGRGYRSDNLARQIAQGIQALLDLDTPIATLPTFKVTRVIQNHEAPGEELYNYVFNKKLGGYPFLVGKTYDHMRGFLTQKMAEHST